MIDRSPNLIYNSLTKVQIWTFSKQKTTRTVNKMKLSECNQRQKKAFKNIKYAANDLIGGLENTLLDYPEDHEYHISAKNLLNNHELLVQRLYENATSAYYEEGFCGFGKAYQSYIRDINFCGKEWLMERCEARVKKCGY